LTGFIYNQQFVKIFWEVFMKKGLFIILALLVVTGLCAFTKGTINPGGTVSFSSYKENSDADGTTTISVLPQVGYFVIDNLAVDVLINYVYQDDQDYDTTISSFGGGLGGRYFYKNFYGGLGFTYQSNSLEAGAIDTSYSGMYLGLKAGYVYPINQYVGLDLGLYYKMGLGKYGGDMDDTDNEESDFGCNVGFQIFLPMK